MMYPDFAFKTNTQIVLFFVVSLCNVLCYYWGANIILEAYQKQISFMRKLSFSIICAVGLNILLIYGVSLINGLIKRTSFLDIGELYNLTRIINPLAYIILYLLGIYLFGLSSYKSIKIMRLLYIYFICCSIFAIIISMGLFPNKVDVRGWNYLRDILSISIGTILAYFLYKLFEKSINRIKFLVTISDNIIVKSLRIEVLKNFLICFSIYLTIVGGSYIVELNIYHYIFLFFLLVGLIILGFYNDYNKMNEAKLMNKDEHILTLNNSIDEFRGIKHDFNNILQTYSGYLTIKDYKKLEEYHRKMIRTTLSSSVGLDISQRVDENPTFFSLLVKKINKSKEKNVILKIVLSCSMKEVYMNNMDFCNVMSIFLDNAIEEAEKTESRQVNFSSQLKPDGGKLFILSNETKEVIDTDDIFLPEFTTKLGYISQGLARARDILHSYGNSMLNITCYKGILTVYLELKPICS